MQVSKSVRGLKDGELPEEERLLMALLKEKPGRNVQQVAELLSWKPGEARERLESAQAQGLVLEAPARGWVLAYSTQFRTGILRVDRRGRGSLTSLLDREDLAFVAEADRGLAVRGDRVIVSIKRGHAGRGKLPEAYVARVLRRTTRLIRVVCQSAGKRTIVKPDDPADGDEIFITEGADRLESGDSALIRLLPIDDAKRMVGELVVNLRDEGSLACDLEIIRAEFKLPGPHPLEVEDAASSLPDIENGASWPDRRDLRDLLTFTIDPADARDFDDAISLEKLADGSLQLGVHIADVSHFAPPGSELDRIAAERGTSIYLPGNVIPMLPERLANGLCSLVPREDRLTKSIFIRFAPDGGMKDVDVCRSVIRSRHRFTYEQVLDILLERETRSEAAGEETIPDDIADLLRDMNRLGQSLRAARRRRGALALDLPKLQIRMDADGTVLSLERDQTDESHQLIEEFMLAANEAVARYFSENQLPLIGRTHPAPDEEKLEEFRHLVSLCGFHLRGKGQSKDLQKLIRDISDSPLSPAIQLALLRTMGHAEYVSGASDHFALATEHYCHFTSPIRRYPDLVVHQVLEQHLRGKLASMKAIELLREKLPEIAQRSSELERRAEDAERSMNKLRLVRYLEPMLGEEMEGWIISVHKFGFFIRTEALLLEGLVHIATLGDDYYRFDEEALSLRGTRRKKSYRLGDRVLVRLSKLDPDSREISFEIVRVLKK